MQQPYLFSSHSDLLQSYLIFCQYYHKRDSRFDFILEGFSSDFEQNNKETKRMTDGRQNITFSIDGGLEDVALVLLAKGTY